MAINRQINASVRIASLKLHNFTIFKDADLRFSRGLNVIVGENGAGKTHILKLLYSIIEVLTPFGARSGGSEPIKAQLQGRLADKLTNVFRAESLGRLARRQPGRQRCEIAVGLTNSSLNTAFSFATQSKTEVILSETPQKWLNDGSVAYIPTRELLTIFPNFISLYDKIELEFDETWRDTCVLLGLPAVKGPRTARVRDLLAPIEEAMGGAVEFDSAGRFYLRTSLGRVEMPLVAEGMRKLGMIARLIATGSLLDNGFLFWDEPEANLNAVLIRRVARIILELSASGIQIFIATHSLFLLRELEIVSKKINNTGLRYFAIQPSPEGAIVQQGDSLDSVGPLSALDEEISQADRFFAADL